MTSTQMYEVQVELLFADDESDKIKKVKEKYLIEEAIDAQDAYTQAYADLTKVGGTLEFKIVSVRESNIVKILRLEE